jgi:hypothetical protein
MSTIVRISTLGPRRSFRVGPAGRVPIPELRCPTSGKRSFEDENDALSAQERWSEEHGWRRGTAYRCPDCGTWHLTSPGWSG